MCAYIANSFSGGVRQILDFEFKLNPAKCVPEKLDLLAHRE
jgi:hypothetical protein